MSPKINLHAHSRGQSIGLALGRIRLATVACCWIVGVALALQMIVWSLAAYTDMRFEAPSEAVVEAEPTVIVAESPRQERIRQAREADMGIDLSAAPTGHSESQQMPGRNDGLFAMTYNLVAGIGRCAMLALIPLMMVGVVLSACSATPGVDRVVSSLVWVLIVAALVLPLGGPFSLPWKDGALSTYGHMTGWVDRVEARGTTATSDAEGAPAVKSSGSSSLIMHGRFGLLPAACIVGITLVGLRFSSGVEAGIIAGESMRLDPELEREAANISPSSLHSGRTTGALSRTLKADDDQSLPTARSVSAGEAPERLI